MSPWSYLKSRGYPDDLYLNPFQVHRPDADELLPTRPGGVCQTVNCDATAVFIVSRGLRPKTVCGRCCEEMTAVLGWTLEGRL